MHKAFGHARIKNYAITHARAIGIDNYTSIINYYEPPEFAKASLSAPDASTTITQVQRNERMSVRVWLRDNAH